MTNVITIKSKNLSINVKLIHAKHFDHFAFIIFFMSGLLYLSVIFVCMYFFSMSILSVCVRHKWLRRTRLSGLSEHVVNCHYVPNCKFRPIRETSQGVSEKFLIYSLTVTVFYFLNSKVLFVRHFIQCDNIWFVGCIQHVTIFTLVNSSTPFFVLVKKNRNPPLRPSSVTVISIECVIYLITFDDND